MSIQTNVKPYVYMAKLRHVIRATCLCCKRNWDIGNYTQHMRKENG